MKIGDIVGKDNMIWYNSISMVNLTDIIIFDIYRFTLFLTQNNY